LPHHVRPNDILYLDDGKIVLLVTESLNVSALSSVINHLEWSECWS